VFEGYFLFFVFFCYFFGFLCFLKSISITKTVRMNRTLACFQKNEIISNFSGIYFWPLPFRVGSEFDKISGCVICRKYSDIAVTSINTREKNCNVPIRACKND
jgi:hypothetical protein